MENTKSLRQLVDEANEGREHKISYGTVRTRLCRGWDIDKAISTPKILPSGGVALSGDSLTTYKGQTKTIKEWVVEMGNVVCYGTVISRLCYGWTLEKAITTPARKRKGK